VVGKELAEAAESAVVYEMTMQGEQFVYGESIISRQGHAPNLAPAGTGAAPAYLAATWARRRLTRNPSGPSGRQDRLGIGKGERRRYRPCGVPKRPVLV